MSDLEQAVRVLFAPVAPVSQEVRDQASAYVEAVKQRPDSWRFCWGQFLQATCLEVKFWCLQVVSQAVLGLAPADRQELRLQALTWFQGPGCSGGEEVPIRNKIALVYVRLLQVDYPAAWPNGWSDLIALVDKGPNAVDMFLRVLAIFDQEVVSEQAPQNAQERQRAQEVKRAMRERDVLHLAESWYMILATFHNSAPQLVIDCLKVISLYIVWIDVHLVANAKFLDGICGLVSEAGPAAKEACDCLGAVIGRKVPPDVRLELFERLQVLQRLEGCVHRNAGADPDLVEKEAELFGTVGEAALELYSDLRVKTGVSAQPFAQAAWEFLKRLMPVIFWFFAHQEFRIADSVEEFLTQFFVQVKSFIRSPAEATLPEGQEGPCHTVTLDEMRPIMMQTLQLIIQRIAYPDWFQHNDPAHEDDDQHLAFLEFRRCLTKIFKRIFLVDEPMGFQFVQASIAQLTQNLASVKAMEVEAVLYLYKEAGELVHNMPQHLQQQGPLATCFVQLVECEALVRVEHWAVQLALIELYVRYGRIFSIHTELFARYGQRIVEAFVGAQGIRSSDVRVVTRACFMFQRFVKVAKQQMAPFMVQVHGALEGLLAVTYIPSALVPVQGDGSRTAAVVKGALRPDDQAGLFEALATLATALPSDQMRGALQLLLKSPAGCLTEMLSSPARVAADGLGHATWAARNIEAIANISKPFTVQHSCVAQDWEETLGLVARLLGHFAAGVASGTATAGGAGNSNAGVAVAKEAGLWRAALFLCRRMVEALGERFLGPLDALLPVLYASDDRAELADLTAFTHHAASKFQSKAQPLLQKWIGVLFQRPYSVWARLPEDSAQLKREKTELGGNLLQLLRETSLRCPTVLLEPLLLPGGGLGGLGQEIASFLLQGLADPSEMRAVCLASGTWGALLEAAAASPASREAVPSLPLAELLQRLLWTAARMDLQDAQAQKSLGEMGGVLRMLTGARLLSDPQRQQAMEGVQQALAMALPGLRDDAAPRQLCEALAREASLKELRAALQRCASDWRRDCGGAAA